MRVKDLLVTEFVTVTPDLPWKEAAMLLFSHHASCAPVLEGPEQKLVGLLSEKDLFRGMFPSYGDWISSPHGYLDFEASEPEESDIAARTVRDVMSHRVITATPDMPVLRVGALMAASGIHHVPVLDNNKVIGLVSRGTIYRAILSKHLGIQM